MRGCHSNGCNQEVAFKAVDGRTGSRPTGSRDGRDPRESRDRLSAGATRVDSRFCLNHTCSHFFRPEGCSFKKPDYDSVCMLHTQCMIPGCLQGKVQYLGRSDDIDAPPKYLRLDYCADHKCSLLGCSFLRVPMKDDRTQFQKFCEHHRCNIEGCSEPKIEGRPFCSHHKCRNPNCHLITAENATLCEAHLKCEIKNCKNPKHPKPNTKDYYQYCEPHVTCDTPNCSALRIEDSCHCAKHTCLERGCNKSSAKNLFCEDHRCSQTECPHPRAWYDRKVRKKLCGRHTCRLHGCDAAVADEELYCGRHACSSPRCKSEIAVDGKCGEHFKLQIEASAKTKMKTQTDDLNQQIRERDEMIKELQEQRVRQLEVRHGWQGS